MVAKHLKIAFAAALLTGISAAATNAEESQPTPPPAAPMGDGNMSGMMTMMQQMSQMMQTCNEMMQGAMRPQDDQPEGAEPTPEHGG